ncbi:hypothetical protein FRC17_008790, partial [Serendipita sp. 399]
MATFSIAKWPEVLPYTQQCYEVPDTKSPGETAHYRNSVQTEIPTPRSNPSQTVSTTYECFEVTLKAHPAFKCLGHRPILSGNVEDPATVVFKREYIWQTYEEVAQRRLNIGSAIQGMFNDGSIGGGELPTVGTWTINRPEWQLVDLALAAYSKVGVALYSTLGRNAVEYIINHSAITMVFLSARNLESLLELAPKCPKLRVAVSLDKLTEATEQRSKTVLKEYNIRFMSLAELESMGEANPLPPTPPNPESIATICYSSGTTSNPK